MKKLLLLLLLLLLGSSPGSAEELKRVPGMERCEALAIHGDTLYAADRERLVIFDLAPDPMNPRKRGEIAIRGARQIATDGKTLYLSARNWGVQVLDVSRPDSPRLLSRIDTAELATGLELAGNLLFVTLRVYGVELFDVSDPAHPEHLSLLRTGEAQSAHYFDGKLAIGDWGASRFTVADVSNPRRPRIIGEARLDGFGDGVWVHGRYGYAATGHHASSGPPGERHGRGHGLEIFDLADPARPRRMGGIKFPPFHEIGNDFWSVRSDGKTAFVGDTHNGFFLVDVTDPASPRLLGRFLLPAVERDSAAEKKKVTDPDCVTGVAVGNGAVYLGGLKTGLFVLPVGARAKPFPPVGKGPVIPPAAPVTVPEGLTRYPVASIVRRLAVRGDELFAACSDAGVKRFRLEKDGSLTETATLAGDRAYDVAVSGDILLVARGTALETYRVTPEKLLRLGAIQGSFYRPYQVVHSFGSIAVCSGGSSWLVAVDISDPQNPRLAGNDAAGSLLYSDAIPERMLDGVFPVNWHGRGIRFYEVKEGKMQRDSHPIPEQKLTQLAGVTAVGKQFIAPYRNGFLLLNPAGASAKAVAVKGVSPSGIPSWDGGTVLALSDRRNGQVAAFDFSDPENPRPLPGRTYDLSSGIPDRVVFHRGRMLIPGWNLGILAEKLDTHRPLAVGK